MSVEYYKLSTSLCRHQCKNRRVCIFVHESVDFSTIATHHICKEKDLKICSVKLDLPKIKIIIITIYRSPAGNYNYFLRKLESLLNLLYANKMEFIICADINVNHLHCHNRRQQLDSLLGTYNLKSAVNFPTRIINGSSTVIVNIFIDLSGNCTINPVIIALSDHDAPLLIIENVIAPIQEFTSCYVRNINSLTIYEFQLKLSVEG